jgi:hypothetical protein
MHAAAAGRLARLIFRFGVPRPAEGVSNWNEERGRKHAEVLDLLDLAIAEARAEEARIQALIEIGE